MTEEELEKEAAKYAIYYPKVEKGEILTSKDLQEAYIAGAKAQKQLREAKELLNTFLRLHYKPIVDECTLHHKVEQFLKGEEND